MEGWKFVRETNHACSGQEYKSSPPSLTMKSQSFALVGLFLSSVLASPAVSKNDQPINGQGKGAPILGRYVHHAGINIR